MQGRGKISRYNFGVTICNSLRSQLLICLMDLVKVNDAVIMMNFFNITLRCRIFHDRII